jgi:hypothetical protein
MLATAAKAALVRSFPPVPPSYPSELSLSLLGDLPTPGEGRLLGGRDIPGDDLPFECPDICDRAFPGEVGGGLELDASDTRLVLAVV